MMLSQIQKEIVETPGNLIVSASAGTGKTHTLVAKIVYDIEHQHTHKVVAAITFTIKAAKEIKERLAVDTMGHFIGTNNSFAIEEIIKPFMKDVYGMAYRIGMSTDYSVEIHTFEEGIDKIKTKQILCSYQDNKKNFIFELALNILKRSKACQLYLKAKYFKIYVDEYQDCDKDMHSLFMYICDTLKIDTFIVGDEKQSIYMWRGAYPEAFEGILNKVNFSKKFMVENFRSCQQIQNYSNLLFEKTRNLYVPVDDLSSVVIVCSSEEKWVSKIRPYLDENKKSALLRYSNENAKVGANKLLDSGIEFTYIPQIPIADITTEAAWLYNAVAKFFILPQYSVYDLRDEIPNEADGNRKILNRIKTALTNLGKSLEEKDELSFYEQVEEIANYLGYQTKIDHCKQLYTTICDEQYHAAFKIDELKHVAMTFHSSKGLEFDQVIIFASDYSLATKQEIYNHYVAVTRAKSKLFIVYVYKNSYANQFANNINEILEKSSLKMKEIATIMK